MRFTQKSLMRSNNWIKHGNVDFHNWYLWDYRPFRKWQLLTILIFILLCLILLFVPLACYILLPLKSDFFWDKDVQLSGHFFVVCPCVGLPFFRQQTSDSISTGKCCHHYRCHDHGDKRNILFWWIHYHLKTLCLSVKLSEQRKNCASDHKTHPTPWSVGFWTDVYSQVSMQN